MEMFILWRTNISFKMRCNKMLILSRFFEPQSLEYLLNTFVFCALFLPVYYLFLTSFYLVVVLNWFELTLVSIIKNKQTLMFRTWLWMSPRDHFTVDQVNKGSYKTTYFFYLSHSLNIWAFRSKPVFPTMYLNVRHRNTVTLQHISYWPDWENVIFL